MHLQIARNDYMSLLDRYLGAAVGGLLRAVKPVDVQQSTLNEFEQSLLRRLVEQAGHHGGPIIEIGTLIGATTTRMALWKSARQRIITVDNYRRNPWRLSPEHHHALAAQVLFPNAPTCDLSTRIRKPGLAKRHMREGTLLARMSASHSVAWDRSSRGEKAKETTAIAL